MTIRGIFTERNALERNLDIDRDHTADLEKKDCAFAIFWQSVLLFILYLWRLCVWSGSMEGSPTQPPADTVWYFAFGSNLMSSVISNRGIKPIAELNMHIPTHALTFDVFGVPYSEPAMASIAKLTELEGKNSENNDIKIPAVHGVAYLLTQEEYVRLIISEGAGIAYREIQVEASPLNSQVDDEVDKGIILVRTLVARYPFRPNPAPSKRYLVSEAFARQSPP